MSSDTPRTDAEVKRLDPFGNEEPFVYAAFARQLERELAEAKAGALVPAEEVEHAFREAEQGGSWQSSRAKRVMEGKE